MEAEHRVHLTHRERDAANGPFVDPVRAALLFATVISATSSGVVALAPGLAKGGVVPLEADCCGLPPRPAYSTTAPIPRLRSSSAVLPMTQTPGRWISTIAVRSSCRGCTFVRLGQSGTGPEMTSERCETADLKHVASIERHWIGTPHGGRTLALCHHLRIEFGASIHRQINASSRIGGISRIARSRHCPVRQAPPQARAARSRTQAEAPPRSRR
jgi:hypothetical protein